MSESHEYCLHTNLPPDWIPLSEYVRQTMPWTDAVFAEMARQLMYQGTRRTVEVTARKYRARRRRKRR